MGGFEGKGGGGGLGRGGGLGGGGGGGQLSPLLPQSVQSVPGGHSAELAPTSPSSQTPLANNWKIPPHVSSHDEHGGGEGGGGGFDTSADSTVTNMDCRFGSEPLKPVSAMSATICSIFVRRRCRRMGAKDSLYMGRSDGLAIPKEDRESATKVVLVGFEFSTTSGSKIGKRFSTGSASSMMAA